MPLDECCALGALAMRRKGRLRILVYARYSTSEQDPTSIDDQVAFCRTYLDQLGIEGDIEVLSDPETSGETATRPGLDRLRQGISDNRWDIIICEDSSRLYRLPVHCGELAETAVDAGVRMIFINDDVDTSEDDWHEVLIDAQQQHARSNKLTRHRLARKFSGLWRVGAAVTQLRPGYIRRPTKPAREFEPAKGPFFDELDPKWAPIVHAVFERIADEEPCWLVAEWLTQAGLPKRENSIKPEWTEQNVISLVRCEVYRGVELHSKKIYKRKYRSRKVVVTPNSPDKIKSRDMPDLRIVPDWLWRKANQAIDARVRQKAPLRGEDNPQWGIPRDSRGPLSRIFVCQCGAKMWLDGGLFRCSRTRKGGCWNKSTARQALTLQNLPRAIIDKLLSLDGTVDVLVEHIQSLQHDDGKRRERESRLRDQERDLIKKCECLGRTIETRDEPPVTLVKLLAEREAELAGIQMAIGELLDAASQRRPTATSEEIRGILDRCSKQLLTKDRHTGAVLSQLIPDRIRAVPYQQFGSNKVVLRAEFELRLVNLLPAHLLAALQGSQIELAECLQPCKMVVDLFERSSAPLHAVAAVELKKRMTLAQVGRTLGISERQADLAAQLGAKMQAAGITDPYIRLTEPPKNASRWRMHRKFTSRHVDRDANVDHSAATFDPADDFSATDSGKNGHVASSQEKFESHGR